MKRRFWLACFVVGLGLLGNACGTTIAIDCLDDLDCPVGSLCIDNFCQGGEECRFDDDCFDPAAICVDGICVDAF